MAFDLLSQEITFSMAEFGTLHRIMQHDEIAWNQSSAHLTYWYVTSREDIISGMVLEQCYRFTFVLGIYVVLASCYYCYYNMSRVKANAN